MPHQKQQVKPNCGRFQAQGNMLEKSRSWADDTVPTKSAGHNYLTELKQQLTRSELSLRQTCFERAEAFIDKAPYKGYDVCVTSLIRIPPYKGVRVDVEVRRGLAFKDNPKNK